MRRRASLAAAALLVLAACTGGGGSDGGGGEGAEPLVPGIDAKVELVAPPESGAGKVPTFEWKAFPGAAAYRLGVLSADGTPIWSWEGTETKVALGGLSVPRPEGVGGPILTEGSTWIVAALDAEGHTLAVSDQRPVSP